MNFDIDNEVYDYNFDVPLCGNFDDFPVDDTDWFENINEPGEELEIDENKENTPIINMSINSKGIQRPSLHRKNNVENTEDNINEKNNSNDVVCQDPTAVMKSKKEKLLSNLKQFNKLDEKEEDEALINQNEAPLIPFNSKQKWPELFKKTEIVTKNPSYLKQTMTACKPKQVQAMNHLCKTAVKSSSTLRPTQTLPKKQPTRAVAPSFMTRKLHNNSGSNNSGSIGLSSAAVSKAALQAPSTAREEKGKLGSGAVGSALAGTARTQMLAPSALGKHAVLPLGATRMERTKKMSDTVSLAGDANSRPKQTNTVPIAPQLATSQRANIKKEKVQTIQQGSTATRTRTGTVTADRQVALARPPVLGKPPFQRSATVSRSGIIDRRPENVPASRARCEEPKERGQEKSAPRQPRFNNASTLPRSANFPSRNVKNPAIWNY